MRISVIHLEAFSTEAFRRAGLSEADARASAEVLVTTDTWGVFTHGTKSLRGYIRRLQAGGIRREGRPRIQSEGPAWAMIDGDAALGMVVSRFAMDRSNSTPRCAPPPREAGQSFRAITWRRVWRCPLQRWSRSISMR